MSSMQRSASNGSGDEEDTFVTGWEGAMAEVMENEYSEHAGREIPSDQLLEDVASSTEYPPASPRTDEDASESIIQSATVDSNPLIQLESTASVGSGSHYDDAREEAQSNGWLDLAESRSHDSSGGDDPVPAISGSGSALDPIDVEELDVVPSDEVKNLVKNEEMSNDAEVLESNVINLLDDPNEIQQEPSQHSPEELLDDTADVASEVINLLDEPNEIQHEPSEHSPEDVSKDTVAAASEVINLLDEPKEVHQEPSQHSAASSQVRGAAVGRIVESLGDHERSLLVPDRSQPVPRLFIGPNRGGLSSNSTFESRGTTNHPSSWDESRTRNPLSPESTVRTSFSVDHSLSVDATTFTRDDTLSPKTNDAFSPNSLYDSVFSDETSVSGTQGGSTFSTNEDTSTVGPSMLSGYTNRTGHTAYTEHTDYTGRSEFTGSGSEVSANSYTGHTRPSDLVSPGAQSTQSDLFSFTGHTRESQGGGPTSQHTRDSESAGALSPTVPDGDGYYPPSAPHDLINLEGEEEEDDQARNRPPSEKKKSHLAETLMAKTRSRADPAAVLSSTSDSVASDSYAKPTMIRVGEELDERFIVNTALARKRVSVVQLLTVGLVSLLVGLFGSIVVQSSCHYVSAHVTIGETDQVFKLHYGLWKYSPVGSAFQGYTYCDKYDGNYTTPVLPRYTALLASIGSGFAVVILWFYLIFGKGTRFLWDAAVKSALAAGILQGTAVFLMFTSPICVDKYCKFGPGGILALVAGAVNLVLAFEMYYNSPIKSWMEDVPDCPSFERPEAVMQTLEMTDFEQGASAYCRRLLTSPSAEIPTLNQIQRKNEEPMGEAFYGRERAQQGAYAPPSIV